MFAVLNPKERKAFADLCALYQVLCGMQIYFLLNQHLTDERKNNCGRRKLRLHPGLGVPDAARVQEAASQMLTD